ncbi:hypothetical protein [Kitasatospora sp. NPDC056800]|uniref:hypothetical protein n=1 Tax=Kitasatospora sp. NPDC056800 TaxID=3345948 RepID=UPI0036A69C24
MRKRQTPAGTPAEDFTCDESSGLDVITVAESTYDPDAVYITASEFNTAGVMTHHIGFFLNPAKAIKFAERVYIEAVKKSTGRDVNGIL